VKITGILKVMKISIFMLSSETKNLFRTGLEVGILLFFLVFYG
jgi:hypothetical protein